VVDPQTRKLCGIIVATDIISYLKGGPKHEIAKQKYQNNFSKAIYEPVENIMTKDVISVFINSTIDHALKLMNKYGLGALPVIDKENRVWAIVTERDIVSMFSQKMAGTPVSKLMTKRVLTVDPNASIKEAEESMVRYGFRRLPLVSDRRLKGIVTATDILRFLSSDEAFQKILSGELDSLLKTKIDKIATHKVITISPDADVGEAAKLMSNHDIGALLVVKDDTLHGIITERDLLKLVPA